VPRHHGSLEVVLVVAVGDADLELTVVEKCDGEAIAADTGNMEYLAVSLAIGIMGCS
jgi:hypothetical protein